MMYRYAILITFGLFVIAVISGLCTQTNKTIANEQNNEYTSEPGLELTPGPHFAYQQQLLAQTSGVARLQFPQASTPPDRTRAPQGYTIVMPTVMPILRTNENIISEATRELAKLNSDGARSGIRAVVQDRRDSNRIVVVLECNCNPRPLLVGRNVPESNVQYITLAFDRRYAGSNVTAGPETDEIRELISRNGGR
jgi:hypothetical protein